MIWGQPINVFTDHKIHMRDALGLTSDRVYQWRLLLEEYGPKIVYIKGIHNTIADAISRLEYDPSVNQTAESYLMTKIKGNSRSIQQQNWLAVWRKPNLCTIRIRTLGAPGIRPDARRVSKARLLSQTSAYPEVGTCHIIAISQDCRSQCKTARSYVRAWYRTDQHVMIHLDQ